MESASLAFDGTPMWWRPHVLISAFLLMCGIVWIASTEGGYLLPVLLLGICFVIWSLRRGAIAVSVIILLHIVTLQPKEGIGLADVVYAGYFFLFLGIWSVRKVFLEKERIVLSLIDLLLLGFLFVSLISIFLVLEQGTDTVLWTKEFVTISGLLLFFPARDAFKRPKDARMIVLAFLILAGYFAVTNILRYRASALAATYFWEILSSRKAVNAHFFFAVFVAAMAFYVHADGISRRLLAASIALVSVVALAFTFARGFWIGALMGVLVLFFLVERKEKLVLVWSAIVIVTVGVVFLIAFPGNLGDVILKSIASRFTSSGNALEDLSVTNRIAESRDLLKTVGESPLIGHGFGARFFHFDTILKVTESSSYAHNAYLFLLFKVGLLGLLLFLGFLIAIGRQALALSKWEKVDPFSRAMVRGIAGILGGVLLIALTSNMFFEKQSLLILSLCAAFISSRTMQYTT